MLQSFCVSFPLLFPYWEDDNEGNDSNEDAVARVQDGAQRSSTGLNDNIHLVGTGERKAGVMSRLRLYKENSAMHPQDHATHWHSEYVYEKGCPASSASPTQEKIGTIIKFGTVSSRFTADDREGGKPI